MPSGGELPITRDQPSWPDCPIVFLVAATWRVELLAPLILEGCGLGADRDVFFTKLHVGQEEIVGAE